MIKKTLFALLLALITYPAMSQQGDQKLLKIFVLKDSPFMSYRNKDGVMEGFHVDLSNLICQELKAECEINETLLINIIDQVSNGTADIGIAALTVTPERSQKVLFSVPYLRGRTVWLSRTPMADSKGLKVAVVEGSTQHAWVNKKSEEMNWLVVPVKVNADLVNAIDSRQAEALVSPIPSAMNILKNKGFDRLGFRLDQIDDSAVSSPLSIAVNPQKTDLLKRLNTIIEDIKTNGKMDEINSKYFPFRVF